MPDEIDEAQGELNEQLRWGEGRLERVLARLLEHARKGRIRDQALRDRIEALEDRVAALEGQ